MHWTEKVGEIERPTITESASYSFSTGRFQARNSQFYGELWQVSPQKGQRDYYYWNIFFCLWNLINLWCQLFHHLFSLHIQFLKTFTGLNYDLYYYISPAFSLLCLWKSYLSIKGILKIISFLKDFMRCVHHNESHLLLSFLLLYLWVVLYFILCFSLFPHFSN